MAQGAIDFQPDTSSSPSLDFQPEESVSGPITDKSTISAAPKKSVLSFSPKKILALPGQGVGGSPIGNPFGLDTSSIENYTQEGRKEHPVLSRVGDVTRNAKELMFGGTTPMGPQKGVLNNPVTMAMSLAPGAAEAGSVASAKVGEALRVGEPLARINKILGVGAKEIRVGSVPESLDEFASNPARGVTKAGIQEKQLAKMNPVERLQAVSKARDAAGTKLDQVLNASADKTINVQKIIDDTFSQIPDKRLAKIATTRLQQILSKANITKPLSQLNPMEARAVQRGLDDFANFSSSDTAKTFGDVATALRRGISQATRKEIPETAELDKDYGDLAGATKAVRRQVNKYARTVPESTLRKILPYAIGGIGGGLAEYGARQILPSQ
jgi:hypothetical protein